MNKERYSRAKSKDPPIEVNQRWVALDEQGEVIRRIRILAPYPDGGWITVDLPSKMIKRDFYMHRTPEFNLRYVFDLEEGQTVERHRFDYDDYRCRHCGRDRDDSVHSYVGA